MLSILWVAQGPYFCLCLGKIIKWLCFDPFYHGLRVILSESGVLGDVRPTRV